MSKTLVAFDFDGTLTFKDSMFDFLIYTFGIRHLLVGVVFTLPYLILHKLKFISNQTAKQKFLAFFFKSWRYEMFRVKAEQYAKERIPAIFRADAKQRFQWHLDQGHQVVIVTASIEEWISPFFQTYGVTVLGTKFDVKDEVLTGKFATNNCYGVEKVKRLKEYAGDMSIFDEIHAYGDTFGDKEMLAAADHPNFRVFKDKESSSL